MTDPLFAPKKVAAPYAGTTGHSGSDTSKERAVRETGDGTAGERQARIRQLLAAAGPTGMTVVELRADRYGLGHHGSVSQALSVMHQEGMIAALKHDRRAGAGVYVLPEYVMGRIVRPFVSNADRRERRTTLSVSERVLIDTAKTSLQRFGRADTIPVRTQNLAALVALVERLATKE